MAKNQKVFAFCFFFFHLLLLQRTVRFQALTMENRIWSPRPSGMIRAQCPLVTNFQGSGTGMGRGVDILTCCSTYAFIQFTVHYYIFFFFVGNTLRTQAPKTKRVHFNVRIQEHVWIIAATRINCPQPILVWKHHALRGAI